MATPDITAGAVFNGARALLNDQEAQVYTNTALLAYLKTAFRELRESLEQSNIPVTNQTDVVMTIPANTTVIGFTTIPSLPADLIEIRQLWQRTTNTNPWYPMTRKEFIPPQLEGIEYTEFVYWAWMNNEIRLLPSNQVNDIKIEYIQQLSEPTNESSQLGIINGQTFLEYRVAALAAQFMMENPERAGELNNNASLALDRLVNVENKAKQQIYTRRRPFRASWKSRTPF